MTRVVRRVSLFFAVSRLRARALVAGAAGLLMTGAAAQAAMPYVVADLATGRVLFSEDATMPWYPASVTKLMTTYVTLKKVKEGKISFDTPIPISKNATSVPPSKVGLKPGMEITLENAMKIMLVKSANDMAVVIAEGVGGTVDNFAAMMNQEAASLGLHESHFVNPNGLFAEGQQTSARDLAILTRALLLEFPEYAGFFHIGSVKLGNRVMKNTNGLIGRYQGIEGMKTGFICPSGFNLVAVANRNGQRLIAVVLGASSGTDRTLKAAQFLDKGFNGGFGSGLFGGGGGTLQSMPASSVAAPPNMREDICVHRKGAPASEEEAEPQTQASAPPGNEEGRSAPVALAAVSQPSGMAAGPRTLGPRAPLEVVPVYVGRNERSASAPVAANASFTPVMVAKKPVEKGAPKTAAAYAEGSSEAAPGIKVKPADVKPLKAGAIAHGVKAKAGPKHGAVPRRPAVASKAVDLNSEAEPAKALEGKVTAGKHGRVHVEIPVKSKAKTPVKAKAEPKAKPGHKEKVAAEAPPARRKKPASTE
ncbi:hypothetical protein SLNSH_11135 [Alsobacter soli]|uniref:Peptidase S11 D-alanyl-D-alanine carboxypeptidase A N-terminal domain-containing protein n=1 Tax=Alsobacter soli TaxID=2109933 RepID=A0A2T1HTK5_9HYPH|nr:serine hydrolase [Alsobacter soli]PSC04992.1 hypothetical protein SLNSH_11135 [Alsobacter soli]